MSDEEFKKTYSDTTDMNKQEFIIKLLNELKNISKSKEWGLIRWLTQDDNLRAKALYDRVAEKTSWNLYELK